MPQLQSVDAEQLVLPGLLSPIQDWEAALEDAQDEDARVLSFLKPSESLDSVLPQFCVLFQTIQFFAGTWAFLLFTLWSFFLICLGIAQILGKYGPPMFFFGFGAFFIIFMIWLWALYFRLNRNALQRFGEMMAHVSEDQRARVRKKIMCVVALGWLLGAIYAIYYVIVDSQCGFYPHPICFLQPFAMAMFFPAASALWSCFSLEMWTHRTRVQALVQKLKALPEDIRFQGKSTAMRLLDAKLCELRKDAELSGKTYQAVFGFYLVAATIAFVIFTASLFGIHVWPHDETDTVSRVIVSSLALLWIVVTIFLLTMVNAATDDLEALITNDRPDLFGSIAERLLLLLFLRDAGAIRVKFFGIAFTRKMLIAVALSATSSLGAAAVKSTLKA